MAKTFTWKSTDTLKLEYFKVFSDLIDRTLDTLENAYDALDRMEADFKSKNTTEEERSKYKELTEPLYRYLDIHLDRLGDTIDRYNARLNRFFKEKGIAA